MPDACQLARATAANGGDQTAGQVDPLAAPPQVSSVAIGIEPKLPKLMMLACPVHGIGCLRWVLPVGGQWNSSCVLDVCAV